MPWFKIDDGFWSHPKTLQLSDGAQALWVRAGSWCMAHLTDGVIPPFALPVLGAKRRFIDELVTVSLWIRDADSYRFHDWEKYQPTRESVEADRDAAAERKRKSREKSRQQSRRDIGVTDGVSSPDAAPSPTRPDPTRPTETPNGVSRTAKAALESAFAEAWGHWPKKVERKQALDRFVKATKRLPVEQLVPAIVRFGDAYAATTETQFVPALGVWLNGDRWTDELPGTRKDTRPSSLRQGISPEEMRRRREEAMSRG